MTENRRNYLLQKYMEDINPSGDEILKALDDVIRLKETKVIIDNDKCSKVELSALYTAKKAVETMLKADKDNEVKFET